MDYYIDRTDSTVHIEDDYDGNHGKWFSVKESNEDFGPGLDDVIALFRKKKDAQDFCDMITERE